MLHVRFLRFWQYPNVLRQSPGGRGEWDSIRLTLDGEGESDVVVVSGKVYFDHHVHCAPENIWLLMQEPPNEHYAHLHLGSADYGRIYHQDPSISSPRHRLSQGALPWHVDKTYDQLTAVGPQSNRLPLSWVTSDCTATAGHRRRMEFLKRLTSHADVCLWGRGFRPIVDKWDGLAPFNYTLAIENFSNEWYWTEKVADAFLAWCMPIYHGCTKLEKYFPADSFIRIDIDDPAAPKLVADIIRTQEWRKRLEAIAEARRRVLNEYQLFPFLARELAQDAAAGDRSRQWNVVRKANPRNPRGLVKRATNRLAMHFAGQSLHRFSKGRDWASNAKRDC